jgi:hypothetical protein
MFTTPKYERKYHDKEKWEDVSEADLLNDIIELNGEITPVFQQLFEGKHVRTSKAVYRIKSSK